MSRRRPLSMNLGLSVAALVAVVGVAASFPRPARGESPAVEGVLVLRNGNVLAGSVRRFGDDYRIDVTGALLHVPAEQVEMFAPSLAEAYEQRRRDRTGFSADSHLELARWCMQTNLLSQAARELLDARTLDSGHSGLMALETRLRQMLESEAARHADERVVPAAANAAIDPQDSDEQLPPAIDVSAEVRTQFVRSIQPMLIRSCAMGGCHQPGSPQRLQLDRWAIEGNGNPDLVRRNLTAVLGALNVDDPPSSALMQWARSAHGRRSAGTSRPLAAHQAALLMEWLNAAAGVAPPAATPTDGVAEEPGMATGEGEELKGDDAATETADSGAKRPRFTPRDEFDPEIFNRQTARRTESNADADAAATDSTPESAPDSATE